jgi:transglutaminase-like putative cysteine protease
MMALAARFPASSQPLLWVVAVLVLTLLPHYSQLPFWVVLLVGVGIVWRLVIESGQRQLPPRLLRIALAIAAMIGILLTYRTLNGLEAGTAFLALLAGMKLLETRGVRDLTVLVFVAYFLLFAGFLYNQQLVLLPYMLLTAWLLTATLMRIHQKSPMSVREALLLTGKMSLQALPVAVLLFVFFPRLPGQFWALPARSSAITGLDDEMSPGDVSELSISGAVAFRVKFEGELPPPQERYWRGPVLHEFDGRTWRMSEMPLVPQELQVGEKHYRYRITLEPHNRHWVFPLDVVTDWPQRQMRRTHDLQLMSRNAISTLSSFELTSATSYQVMGPLPLSTQRAMLNLPPNRNPRSLELARRMRAQAGDDEAFIRAVLDMFREQEYFYTLEPPRLEADSVDDFLFNTRRGFCEHFASAFTFMARAAGIPARVVTGYQGGDFNPLGGHLIVRQSDAHAWSEVWIDGRGWVRVDPTAAVAPERVERGIDAAMDESEPVPGRVFRRSSVLSRVLLAWDAVNAFWNDQIIEFGASQQRSLLQWLGIDQPDWRNLGVALAITLAGFFAILSAYLAWQFRPRARDPVAEVYQHLCRKLARHQLARQPHEGPDDYLGRVIEAKPALAAQLSEIRTLYISLRYGPSPLSSSLSRLKFLVGQLEL